MMTGINSFSATTNRLTTASYDSADNMTFNPVGMQQTYNAENRLITYVDPLAGANNRTYAYDGDGRRVLKTITSNGKRTVFVYDAFGRLAAEYSESGSPGGGLQYRTTDHLGSTRAVTNVSGTVTAYYDYTPFGERITSLRL